MAEAVVIFSGGPDSTAAVRWALKQGYTLELLTFQFRNESQYGELCASMELAKLLGLHHTIFDFKSPMQHFSTGVHILMHSGASESDATTAKSDRLRFGVGMILSVAANYALYKGKDILIWGATLDDAGGSRFDYTQEFCDRMAELISQSIGRQFSIISPLATMHKHEIVKSYFSDNPHLFSKTWSCKTSAAVQCGACHPCRARRIASKLATLEDETSYASREMNWHFSEEQFASPDVISKDELKRLFESEPTPDPTDN